MDPGETTGWSIWTEDCGKLLGGGQTPLWQFALDLKSAICDNVGPLAEHDEGCLFTGVDPQENKGPINLIVCEKFTIYPWAAKDLAWNEVRTAQLIGAITLLGLDNDIRLEKQPASIKERAEAGGAKELFVRPLHENRHQNDSIMHGFFYQQVVARGVQLPIPDGARKRAAA